MMVNDLSHQKLSMKMHWLTVTTTSSTLMRVNLLQHQNLSIKMHWLTMTSTSSNSMTFIDFSIKTIDKIALTHNDDNIIKLGDSMTILMCHFRIKCNDKTHQWMHRTSQNQSFRCQHWIGAQVESPQTYEAGGTARSIAVSNAFELKCNCWTFVNTVSSVAYDKKRSTPDGLCNRRSQQILTPVHSWN